MRAFIAIELPDEAKKEIVRIQKQLPKFRGKLTEFNNLHLTLKFLGEISDEKIDQIKQELRKIKFNKFEADLGELGVFSEEFIRIVWIHFSGAEKLQKEIDKKLEGIFEKERRFMSHLTIARIKQIQDKRKFLDELKKIKIKNIKFLVENFTLISSELTSSGPIYAIIEKFGLE